MPELVLVIVIAGIIGLFVAPKLEGAVSMRDEGWRDQVKAAIRYAQKSALAHRRLVCVTVASTSITLNIASANPATTCNQSLLGPDAQAVFATSSNAASATSVAPSGVIYFQPDGRATSDGAGSAVTSRVVSMSGGADITIYGETGYVE